MIHLGKDNGKKLNRCSYTMRKSTAFLFLLPRTLYLLSRKLNVGGLVLRGHRYLGLLCSTEAPLHQPPLDSFV